MAAINSIITNGIGPASSVGLAVTMGYIAKLAGSGTRVAGDTFAAGRQIGDTTSAGYVARQTTAAGRQIGEASP